MFDVRKRATVQYSLLSTDCFRIQELKCNVSNVRSQYPFHTSVRLINASAYEAYRRYAAAANTDN